jgi:hypothetical protein
MSKKIHTSVEDFYNSIDYAHVPSCGPSRRGTEEQLLKTQLRVRILEAKTHEEMLKQRLRGLLEEARTRTVSKRGLKSYYLLTGLSGVGKSNKTCPLVVDHDLPVVTAAPTACDECKQPLICQRICECMRFHCRFGAVDKP